MSLPDNNAEAPATPPASDAAAADVPNTPAEHEVTFQDVLRDRIFRLGAGFIGFILIFSWVGLFAGFLHESGETLELQKQELRRLTYTLAEHVRSTFDGADQVLKFSRRELRMHGELPLEDPVAGSIIDTNYRQILVTDAAGNLVATTLQMTPERRKSINLADRRFFQELRDSPGDPLFISRTGTGRVSGSPSIPVARKYFDRNGRFDGVISISFPPHYFTTVQRKMDLPRGVSITLIGNDGYVRTHIGPEGLATFGQDVGSIPLFREMISSTGGLTYGISLVRKLEGIISYRRVPGYDLMVVLSLPKAVYGEDALEATLIDFGVGVFITIASLLSLWLFYREIVRRRRIFVALRLHESRLVAAGQTKDRLIASVSHELRTPLTSVLGYARLITRSAESEEVREYAHHVHGSALHLRDLVNSMLDLAKIDEGRLEPVFEVTDLRPAIVETVELFRVAAEEKGVALSLTIDDSAPITVITDRTRITQILSNLLSNAIKFTVKGDIRVTVTGESDHYVIRVQDSGIGIPADQVEKLFERFSNLDARGQRSMQGAGLGLALVRELSMLLGGSVSVESAPNVGSTFQIRLPRVPPASRSATPGGDT